MKLSAVVCLAVVVSTAEAAVKVWTGPNNNYGTPKNWQSGKLPCSGDSVTFDPTWAPSTVFIQHNMEVSTLTFPMDGTFVFAAALNITLGGRPAASCTGSGSVFKGQAPGNWDDPSNWETRDSTTSAVLSTATVPLKDRVPCDTDTVRFPAQTAASVQVNRPVTVSQFIINNKNLASSQSLWQYLASPVGKGLFRLPSSNAIQLGPACSTGSLCKCGTGSSDVVRSVCSYSSPTCSAVPGCRNPVMMMGDCCAMCGSLLNITTATLTRSSLDIFLSSHASLKSASYRVQVVDKTHVQVLIVGMKTQAIAAIVVADMERSPVSVGLSATATVTIMNSITPTTQPPITQFVPSGDEVVCVKVIPVTKNGEEVKGTDGKVLTEVVTFQQETHQPNNEAQSTTSSSNVPWFVTAGVALVMVVIILVLVVLLLRRKGAKFGPRQPLPGPVHFSPQAAGLGAVNIQDFGDDSGDQFRIYDDVQQFSQGGGVTNPIYVMENDNEQLVPGE